MTYLGVLALNALFALAGLGIFSALRGWKTWRDFVAHLGLAYMLGVATVVLLATLTLVFGFGLSTGAIFALAAIPTAGGAAVGRWRRTPLPTSRGALRVPTTVGDLLTAAAVATTAVATLAMLRAFWKQPLIAWDAWSFWIPKAKAIYFFGGLDEHLFRTLAAPSYPLFVPALDAMSFRFAGAADPTVLSLQNWLLLVGFVAAAAAILGAISRRGLTWLFLAVAVVIPEIVHRWFQLMADWTLDVFFVLSALLLLRWLKTREGWLLCALPLFAAAMISTKREGLLLAACLFFGAALATMREWRRQWPVLFGIALLAFLINVPWRLWWTTRHLASDAPDSGFGTLTAHADRILPSLRIVLQLTFDYNLWLLTVPVAVVAAIAALSSRDWNALGTFYLATGVAGILGFMWVLWSNPSVPLTTAPALSPIPRAVGSLSLLSIAFSPALITGLLAERPLPVLAMSPRAALRELRRFGRWVGSRSPVRVLATLIAAQWVAVAGLALAVRHNGWVFYQGGDQLWYYTLGWLLGHGELTQTQVGYGWSVVLAPLSRIAGPNLLSALPVILLLNLLVLLPTAMLALYGIAVRIGGRLFGYWTLLVWIAVPFIGIVYTNAGYHQRYTELTLPQSLGLTAMADFPSTVACLVTAYFVARVVFDEHPQLIDAVAGGVAAGATIAIKPSAALFLVGPALAFAYRRRLVSAAAFVAGILPALLALMVWKQRGLGHLPILGAPGGRPQADGAGLAAGAPIAGLDFGKYFHNLNWQHFIDELDQLREHFWSGRLIQWLVVAGMIALARRSRTGLLLVGGSFAAYIVVKGSYQGAGIEDSSLFRIMMPVFPAFVICLASLPFLLPHAPRRLAEWRPDVRPAATRRQWALVAAAMAVSGVAPLAAFAAADTAGGLVAANIGKTGMPIPANIDLGLDAAVRGGTVTLRWRGSQPAGGPVFFRIWRARRDVFRCTVGTGGKLCNVSLPEVGVSRTPEFRDRPAPGRWVYRVAIAANWLDDPAYGDPYLVSRPLVVTVR